MIAFIALLLSLLLMSPCGSLEVESDTFNQDAGVDTGLYDASTDTRPPLGDHELAAPWDSSGREVFANGFEAGCLDVGQRLEQTPSPPCLDDTCIGTPVAVASLDVTCGNESCGAFSRFGTVTPDPENGQFIIGGERDPGPDRENNTPDDIPLPSGFTARLSNDEIASKVVIATGQLAVTRCDSPCTRAAGIALIDSGDGPRVEHQIDAVASVRLVAYPSADSSNSEAQFVVGTEIVHSIPLTDNAPVDVQLALSPSGHVIFAAGTVTHTAQVPVPQQLSFAVYGYGDGNNEPDAVIRSARVDLAPTFWPAAGQRTELAGVTVDTQFVGGGADLRLKRVSENGETRLVLISDTGESTLNDLYPTDDVRLVYHAGLTEPLYGLWWDRGVFGFAYDPIRAAPGENLLAENGAVNSDEANELCSRKSLPFNFRVADVLMYQGVPLVLAYNGNNTRLYGVDSSGLWAPVANFAIDHEAQGVRITRAFGRLFVAAEIPGGTRPRLELLVVDDNNVSHTFELVTPSGNPVEPDAFGATKPSIRVLGNMLNVIYTGDSRREMARMSIEVPIPSEPAPLVLPLRLP